MNTDYVQPTLVRKHLNKHQPNFSLCVSKIIIMIYLQLTMTVNKFSSIIIHEYPLYTLVKYTLFNNIGLSVLKRILQDLLTRAPSIFKYSKNV